MIQRSTHPALLRSGIRKVFFSGYKDSITDLKKLYNVQDSSKAYEIDYRMAAFGSAKIVNEGANVDMQDSTDLYENQYNHIKYGLGFKVSDEAVNDDQYGKVMSMTRALSRSMRGTIQILAATVYANAFTTAGYDGKVLCADDHPIADGSTGDNKTTAALDALGLEQALELFHRFKSDEGFYIDVDPQYLVVPPELKFTAVRLLKSMGYPTIDLAAAPTAGSLGPNDTNVLGDQGLKLVVFPYLTDEDDWFVRANTGEDDGILWFWREEPDMVDWRDNDSRAQCYNSVMRLSKGFSDWRGIVGSSV